MYSRSIPIGELGMRSSTPHNQPNRKLNLLTPDIRKSNHLRTQATTIEKDNNAFLDNNKRFYNSVHYSPRQTSIKKDQRGMTFHNEPFVKNNEYRSMSRQIELGTYLNRSGSVRSKPVYFPLQKNNKQSLANNSLYLNRFSSDKYNLQKKKIHKSSQQLSQMKNYFQNPANLNPRYDQICNNQCLNPPQPQRYFEYVPYEERYIELQPREVVIIQYVPIQKTRTNYYTVQHITEYQPRESEETYFQMTQQIRQRFKLQYKPVERRIIHLPQEESIPTVEVPGGKINTQFVTNPNQPFVSSNEHDVWNPRQTKKANHLMSNEEQTAFGLQRDTLQDQQNSNQPLHFESPLVTSNVKNYKFKAMFYNDEPSFLSQRMSRNLAITQMPNLLDR